MVLIGTILPQVSCAYSKTRATGHGEYFMRLMIAHDISSGMEYGKLSLAESAKSVIHIKLSQLGGTGGIIALDHYGRRVMEFNTAGMYRAWVDSEGDTGILFYEKPTM
jgi:beta-aspartyl-peptidase (threonine type)